MPNFGSASGDEFFRSLTEYFSINQLNNVFSVLRDPDISAYTQAPDAVARPDFMVLKGNYPYMVVQIIEKLSPGLFERYIQRGRLYFDLLGVDYLILTDNQRVWVFDFVKLDVVINEAFDSLFRFFGKSDESAPNDDLLQEIETVFKDIIERSELEHKRALMDFAQKTNFKTQIVYNANGRFFHFKSNPELGLDDTEHLFFRSLLREVPDTRVCRYTTLESLFILIDRNSYRLASDIAMNDRGEIDYADKYIKLFYKPLNSLTLAELQQMNKNFISSCTTMQQTDNLTMFRLYGEDTKGVCLWFDFDSTKQSRNMIVRRVSYAQARGRHLELDIIERFITTLSSVYRIRFRMRYLDTWKHFFKSWDYAIEDEIRLLYMENTHVPADYTSWIVSSPDHIVSRFAIFDLSKGHFPLSLNKIILGPNCPDHQVNRRQLEVFLAEKGMGGVIVENSKIESYRKS